MKRVAVLFLVAIVFALAPAAVSAQGLFGSGLPSFGGFMGGPSTCGEKCGGPTAGTTLYVGWMDDPNGVRVGLSRESGVVLLPVEARQQYRVSGLWLGVTQSCPLTDNVGFLASGWYLFPANHRSNEEYNLGGQTALAGLGTSWSTKTQWWFVDGLLAFGGGNTQFLAGVRYDYLSTSFDDRTFGGVPVAATADATSYGFIPLFGIQYAQSGLLFRIVGVPTLAGSFRYRELIPALGNQSFEGSGNYNGGYFLEAFGEYGFKMGGSADVGIFARYNVTQGRSVMNFDLLPVGFTSDYRLSLYRSSWTLGGKFSLNFTIPYM